MKCKNNLPPDHAYHKSKTEKQWRKAGRALREDAVGCSLHPNQMSACVTATYYTFEETRAASDEEMQQWKDERNKRRRELRAEKRAARQQAESEARLANAKAERERQMLMSTDRKKIICLDLETTGLDKYADEILQISAIDGNGEVLINEYIKPERASSWEAAEAVNGISPEMVSECSSIRERLPEIQNLINAADLVVGYNIDFDLGFLRQAGVSIPKEAVIYDVMTAFAEIYGEWNEYFHDYKWQKLQTCAEYYGYTGDGSFHDSLEDVRATLYCFYKILNS